MAYDQKNCPTCPYNLQAQIYIASQMTSRQHPPITLEDNASTTLLVFQAPGIEEWLIGSPIQPTVKKGGTAGRRIFLSWKRKRKQRSDFDIVNAVQCYPGTVGIRDAEPSREAVTACIGRLKTAINAKNYSKIVSFGSIAAIAIDSIMRLSAECSFAHIRAIHPNGGCKNKDLDSLW